MDKTPLDQAQRAGGIYHKQVGDTFVATDAHGAVIENAPTRQPDTPPEKQTGFGGEVGPDGRTHYPEQPPQISQGIKQLQELVRAEVSKAAGKPASRDSVGSS